MIGIPPQKSRRRSCERHQGTLPRELITSAESEKETAPRAAGAASWGIIPAERQRRRFAMGERKPCTSRGGTCGGVRKSESDDPYDTLYPSQNAERRTTMFIPLRTKTRSGITAQAEDYSADEIERPYRITAFLPMRDGKQKYRPVRFAFTTMETAVNALCDMTYGSAKLSDYASKLIEPENERYIRNL